MSAAAKKKPQARRKLKKTELVYGLGLTGLSVARYFAERDVRVRFVDSREEPPGYDELKQLLPDAEVVVGETPDDLIESASRLIVSPGIADHDGFVRAARDAGIEIVSDIDLFTAEAQAPIVAVTGSNGKSTVTTLLSLMCSAAGKRGLAGANLGPPALDLLREELPDFYILELSSFQLHRTKHLPASVAVLLNVAPDHLDWHRDEAEYRQAKYRIFREADAVVLNRADPLAVSRLRDDQPFLSFGLDEPGDAAYGIREEDGEYFLARGEQLLLSVADVAMVGSHNHANALAALAAGQLMGLPIAAMLQVLNQFPGLPHRMQVIGITDGVCYINDSKATNVDAAVAAVESLETPVVLIAGGQGKGGDFGRLASKTAGKLRAVILIGEDALRLAEAFEGLTPTEYASDMHMAVRRAAELAEYGDTVLLAPACASFDQYPNYRPVATISAWLAGSSVDERGQPHDAVPCKAEKPGTAGSGTARSVPGIAVRRLDRARVRLDLDCGQCDWRPLLLRQQAGARGDHRRSGGPGLPVRTHSFLAERRPPDAAAGLPAADRRPGARRRSQGQRQRPLDPFRLHKPAGIRTGAAVPDHLPGGLPRASEQDAA